MRISDWSSDVCSSDLRGRILPAMRASIVLLAAPTCFPRARRSAAQKPRLPQSGGDRGPCRSGTCRGRARSEERRVGKECVKRVDLGGRRIVKKHNTNHNTPTHLNYTKMTKNNT